MDAAQIPRTVVHQINNKQNKESELTKGSDFFITDFGQLEVVPLWPRLHLLNIR